MATASVRSHVGHDNSGNSPAFPAWTWEEYLEVGRARNAELYRAEHDEEATPAEVSERVRRAEAEATARVIARREAEVYRPTAPPDFEPTPAEQAWALGHSLGREGIPAAAPRDQPEEVRAAFARGYESGTQVYHEELEDELHARLDRMDAAFGDPWDNVNPIEIIEAVGAVATREIGGGR